MFIVIAKEIDACPEGKEKLSIPIFVTFKFVYFLKGLSLIKISFKNFISSPDIIIDNRKIIKILSKVFI